MSSGHIAELVNFRPVVYRFPKPEMESNVCVSAHRSVVLATEQQGDRYKVESLVTKSQ